jgi:putative ABC transport system permease protein
MYERPVTQAIGIEPELGRWFTPEEDAPGSQRVMLISHKLWQTHFEGAKDVLGRTMRVADFSGDDSPSTIIGVMPEGFGVDGTTSDYFIPLRNSGRGRRAPVRNRWIVARLQPGVSIAQAQSALNIVAPTLAQLSPMNKGWGLVAQPLLESRIGGVRSPLAILEGVAAVVLLIACANVAGLLLAQGMSRSREIAVRTALGSRRARVIRQLLTESVLLAFCGAAVSVLVLLRGMPVLTAWLPISLDNSSGSVSLNVRVLAFTLVVSVVTALLFGILPALQASRPDLTTAFKDANRSMTAAPSRLFLRNAFVVMQISLAVVLLTGAGLLVNSLLRLNRVEAGFKVGGLTAFQMNFTGQQFFHQTGNVTPSGSLEFELTPRIDAVASDIRDRLRALPGVDGVTTIANGLPLGGARRYEFTIGGGAPVRSEREDLTAEWLPIGPEYFRVLGAPVIRGREFTANDRRGAQPVALVSQTMAQKYWPNDDPIGKTISVQFFNDVPREIVGVVGDIRQNLRDPVMPPQIYVPYSQLPTIQEGRTAFGLENVNFIVRSRAPLSQWVAGATTATTAADPLHAMSNVMSLEQFVERQNTGFRQYVVLLAVFSGIALVLAVIGIYGVMTHSVAQRTGEIGIRVAFGAQARDVLALVLRHAFVVIGTGVALGVAAALGATRLIASFLWGVTASDPQTYAVVLATSMLVALFACLVPAYRAVKVDPLTAIRGE